MVDLAAYWAQYSTCLRRQIGAVAFDPDTHQILGLAYNDTRAGETNCGDGGCEPCAEGSVSGRTACRCVHAEANLLSLSVRHGVKLGGSWIALASFKDGIETPSKSVCQRCDGQLYQAGIQRAIMRQGTLHIADVKEVDGDEG